MRNSMNNERINISRRDQKNAYVAILPLNYAKWQEEYFFIDSAYIPRSWELWISGDEMEFHVHPMSNRANSNHEVLIYKMCQKHHFGKGVPFNLDEKEDFNFEGG